MVRCLERADEFADSYGHGYTGVEHLVMSILADGDAVPTVIADRMGALGVLVHELNTFCETGEIRDSVTRLVPDPEARIA